VSPGVKLRIGGTTGACPNDPTYLSAWYGGTNFSTASTVTPDAACCGTQLNPTTLTGLNPSKNGKVTITSVGFGGTSSAPTFTVNGSGFGSQAQHPTAPVCPDETSGAGVIFAGGLYFNDTSSADWQAGFGNDCIGLVVSGWSDSTITFTLGSWYAGPGAAQGTILNNGDPFTMTVRGAHFTGTVSGLA
jgi:hypothetical protein